MGTRREFLGGVGRGMLVASVGLGTALDMGLAPAWADDEGDGRITFGGLEPLVGLMQETAVDRLVPVLVEKLSAGTDLQVAGGRRGAGQRPDLRRRGLRRLPHADGPRARPTTWRASCPRTARALPVLKVLYRNTNRIQEHGGRALGGAAPGQAGHALGRARPGRGAPRRRPPARTWTGPRAPSPRSPPARPTRRSTACSSPSRTTPRSTASSCRIAPGTCSTSWAGSRPTRCSASRSATASRASRRRSTGR